MIVEEKTSKKIEKVNRTVFIFADRGGLFPIQTESGPTVMTDVLRAANNEII